MAFNSAAFLFAFLPLCMLVYFLVPRRFRSARNAVLLLFSLAFYAWGGVRLLPILLASCAFNYAAGLLLGRYRRAWLLALAVAADAALLGYCKYAGFFAANLAALGLNVAAPSVILPAGISFFTFQSIAYLADVYRGTISPERNALRFTLFTAFFPQLLQGPILRYADFGGALARRTETAEDVSAGLVRFCFGLAKKVLLADAIGVAADAAFSAGARLTTAMAWIGAAGYTLQLYLDFSGYTDMALGLGRVFGFTLPENFDYPYIAKSAGEFWRRWHKTLSFWFRDYVYIPLGGSRTGATRQVWNLLAVWLLTGLWHGAAWTFVFWGLYYCVLLLGERFVWGRLLEKCPAWARHVYTLLLVTAGWVLFRAPTLAQAGSMLAAMFGFAPAGAGSGEALYYLKEFRWEWIFSILAATPIKVVLERRLAAAEEAGSRASALVSSLGVKLLASALLGFSCVRLLSSTFRSFLYFQF